MFSNASSAINRTHSSGQVHQIMLVSQLVFSCSQRRGPVVVGSGIMIRNIKNYKKYNYFL